MSDTQDPRAACQSLVSVTSGTLEWEWDGRFECALAAFGAAHRDTVRAAIEETAPNVWTVENVASAPPAVQAVASSIGLRAGQLLFVSDDTVGVMLYAAWWPWSGGQRFSVRVGAEGAAPGDLATWFGL